MARSSRDTFHHPASAMSCNGDEKRNEDVPQTASSSTSSDKAPAFLPSAGVTNVDAAWKFLNDHREIVGVDAVNLNALRRKIDWHIVPLMFLCYTMQFLDKVILNVSIIGYLSKALVIRRLMMVLDSTQQSWVSTRTSTFLEMTFPILPRFSLLVCCALRFQTVSNMVSPTRMASLLTAASKPIVYFLQVIPAAKWLGANVALWGVATACGAAAHNYQSLLASRIFLGIFEATIAPSLMLISSQWYTKSEQAPRFSFWYLGLGLGQIVGGLVSFGFQHMAPGAALAGWRTMFVTLGCVTVVLGICTFLFIPDTPMKAKWLSDAEKVALLKHVSVNQTGISSRKFRYKEILEALGDPQIYLLLLSVILISISSGVITTYSSTLIKNILSDQSPDRAAKNAALLNMPSGLVSIAFTLIVGFGVRKQSQRWAWIIACIIPA